MNIKILARALQKVIDAHEDAGTIAALSKLSTNATNGVSNASHQTMYVSGKKELLAELKSAGQLDILDYEIFLLEETALAYLLPHNVADKILSITTGEDLTLAVVGKNILEFKSEIDASLLTAEQMITSLTQLGISPLHFDEGDAAIAISIPSKVYNDDLKKLGKKFTELEKTVSQILTYTTGEPQDIKIKAMSNTSASIIMGVILAAADRFSVVLERLTNAAINYQEAKLKALEYKSQKIDLDDKMKARLEASAIEQEKIAEEILTININTIVLELNKSDIANSKLGFNKSLRELVAQINEGIDYDVLAIPHEDAEGAEEGVVKDNGTISKINSRSDRDMMKLIRKIEPRLLPFTDEPDDEET